MINSFVIYGERCSGTNYLENIIKLNFDIEYYDKKYGWKHFFGFDDLTDSDNTLFICIVRNPYDWLNSLFITPSHLCYNVRENKTNFLNNTLFSFDDNYNATDENLEIMEDRNIYTKEKYKNIFELRHTKLDYLIRILPTLVKNYILIRYEDLLYNFENELNKFKKFNLKIRDNIIFPVNNTNYDFKYKNNFTIKKYDKITKEEINNNKDFIKTYEKLLNYIE